MPTMSLREYAQTKAAPPSPSMPECPVRSQDIAGMPLPSFINSALTLRIHSAILGCEVLLAGKDADLRLWHLQHPEANAFLPVYQGQELRSVVDIGSESALRLLHEAKTFLGASRILADDESPALPARASQKGTRH